jgi:uncharacterized protein YigE (DUF2233 family)
MISRLPLLLVLLGSSLCPRVAAQQPDKLLSLKAEGVDCRVISVDLKSPMVRVTVLTAMGFPGTAEPFGTLLARHKPTIAVNGAYFSKATLRPIGDIVANGELLHKGLKGTALAITRENEAIIRRVQPNRTQDWSAYDTVLACGPALVLNDEIDVLVTDEGFSDPHILGAQTRMGVGLTADGRMLIVNTLRPVTFAQWARVMKALGCRDAMNLDAGASLAMSYRGRTLIRPGRNLTNLLAVYVDSRPRDGAGPSDPAAMPGSNGE